MTSLKINNGLIIKLSMAALLSAPMIGCGSGSSSTDESEASLTDTQWTLISYGPQSEGKTPVLVGSSYTLDFDQQSTVVDGSIDCNSFQSSYWADEQSITFDAIATTEIGCPLDGKQFYDSQKSFITTALEMTFLYTLSAEKLTLISADYNELIFEPTFAGCTDPAAIINADFIYFGSYYIAFEPEVDTPDHSAQLQQKFEDLIIIDTTFSGLLVNSSDQTLQKIRCEEGVQSINLDTSLTATTTINSIDKTRCSDIQYCGSIGMQDCGSLVDGPLYYFNTQSGEIISICGGACLSPDTEIQAVCATLCPPPEWNCND